MKIILKNKFNDLCQFLTFSDPLVMWSSVTTTEFNVSFK